MTVNFLLSIQNKSVGHFNQESLFGNRHLKQEGFKISLQRTFCADSQHWSTWHRNVYLCFI